MSRVGKPITEQERRSRSIFDLIQYGIVMAVRRDIGGRGKISKVVDMIKSKLVGRTATESAKYAADGQLQLRAGIAQRISRNTDELKRRSNNLSSASVKAQKLAEKQQFAQAYQLLDQYVDMLLCDKPQKRKASVSRSRAEKPQAPRSRSRSASRS